MGFPFPFGFGFGLALLVVALEEVLVRVDVWVLGFGGGRMVWEVGYFSRDGARYVGGSIDEFSDDVFLTGDLDELAFSFVGFVTGKN